MKAFQRAGSRREEVGSELASIGAFSFLRIAKSIPGKEIKATHSVEPVLREVLPEISGTLFVFSLLFQSDESCV